MSFDSETLDQWAILMEQDREIANAEKQSSTHR